MAIGTAAAIIGGAVLGGAASVFASDEAADAQKDASAASIAEQRRQYDTTLQLLDPQRQLGYGAMADIAQMYGYSLPGYDSASELLDNKTTGTLPSGGGSIFAELARRIAAQRNGTSGAPATPPAPTDPSLAGRASGPPGDMSKFFASPDYNFRLSEGNKAIDRSAAARGGALGGNAVKAGIEYSGNLASGEFGNYMNRLFSIAGMNQTATGTAINAGTNMANNVSGSLQQAGDARASGIMGAANGITGSVNNGISNYLLSQYLAKKA